MDGLGGLAAMLFQFSFGGWPPGENLKHHSGEIPLERDAKTWGSGDCFVIWLAGPSALWNLPSNDA